MVRCSRYLSKENFNDDEFIIEFNMGELELFALSIEHCLNCPDFASLVDNVDIAILKELHDVVVTFLDYKSHSTFSPDDK